jgi:hypothetical protein
MNNSENKNKKIAIIKIEKWLMSNWEGSYS